MKNLKNFLFESRQLTVKLLQDAIDELFNGVDAEEIMLYFKENGKKSIYAAFEEDPEYSYDLLCDFVDFMYDSKYECSIPTLKELIQKNDKTLTDFINKEWGDYIDKNIN